MKFKKEGIKKYVLAIMLMSFVIFLSGCAGKQTDQEIVEDVYTGTQGLKISFIDTGIPSKLYVTPDTTLPVALKIENKGATTLSYSDIAIFYEGFDHNYITGIPYVDTIEELELEGKSSFNREGGSTIRSFESGPIILPSNSDGYDPNFAVSWLYNYQTVASTDICIDPNPYQLSGVQKPCKAQDVSLGGGQGAPVGVTKIEVKPGSSATRFIIHIRNLGTGSIVNNDVFSPIDISLTNINKIEDYEVIVGSDYVYCQPSKLQFFDQSSEAVLQCTYEHPYGIENAYETVIQVRLSYRYYDSISKQLDLIKVEDYENRLYGILSGSGYSTRGDYRGYLNTLYEIDRAIKITDRTIDAWESIGR